MLDAVQDPGNFGTLVRTAEALGAAGVVALPGTVDPWNPKSIRAAVGSSFRLPIVSAGWAEAARWLRAEGFALLAAAVGGGRGTGAAPGAVGAGGGQRGRGPLGRRSWRRADRTVGVPLRGRAESLNVAAAAAILLYELLR